MTTPVLGRLERVDLRKAWKHEATGFTPWLAQPGNIGLLGQAIDLELEVQAQEHAVGPFRADILCRTTDDNSLVLIENQLARTDHGHLGQLLTYAAGLKAVTLIWIAERFTDEHRAALDWLNEITHEDFHCFGLEIELWRIGDSPFAPKFNVVVQPNDWARNVQKVTSKAASPMGQLQAAFWAGLGDLLVETKAPFKKPKASPSSWIAWGLGRSGIKMVTALTAKEIAIQVEVEREAHPTWFEQLLAQKQPIEADVGFSFDWEARPEVKLDRVRVSLPLDLRDESTWPAGWKWMRDRMVATKTAFRDRVKALADGPMEPHHD